MIIDTSKDGLEMLFRPYQIIAINILFSEEVELSSKQVWDKVNEEMHPERISRASVINFLNDASEQGVLHKRKETGKGGYRGIYSRNITIPDLWNRVLEEVFKKVTKARLDALLESGLITEEDHKNSLKDMNI